MLHDLLAEQPLGGHVTVGLGSSGKKNMRWITVPSLPRLIVDRWPAGALRAVLLQMLTA